MTADSYGITARDLAEQLAEASRWDSPDIGERPQCWKAFGEDATPPSPEE